MKRIISVIDSISEYTGKSAKWLVPLIFVVLCCEVVMRYVFNSPTFWAHEVSTELGLAVYALGWAYCHRHHGHVRVDVIYDRLPPRGKALIDVGGYLLLFLPLLIALTYFSALWMHRAWSINEIFTETLLYPPAAPIRTVLFLGFSLFLIQSIAQFIRDLYLLTRGKPL